MEFEVEALDADVTRLRLAGRLDAASVSRAEQGFTDVIGTDGTHILLDVAGISLLTSLGIRLLIGSARIVDRRGCRMAIFGAPPHVQEIFETVALDDLIPVFDTEAEAMALLRG